MILALFLSTALAQQVGLVPFAHKNGIEIRNESMTQLYRINFEDEKMNAIWIEKCANQKCKVVYDDRKKK